QDAELIPIDAATFIFRLENQLARRSIAEDKSFWQVELPEDQPIKNVALLPGNNLVVTSTDKVQMLDGQNGSVSWVFEAEHQQILNALVTSSKLILSTTVENSLAHQLRAFDLETRAQSWTYALGTTIKAPILQSGQQVLVSTFDQLISLDLDNGKLINAQAYPLWFQLGAPQQLDYAPFQADLIRIIDQNIYVSRSTGLVAFQGEQLKKWFEYPTFESYIYTPHSLNKRFVFEKELYMGADPEKELPDFFEQQTAYLDFQNQNLMNQIADNQRTIDASLRGKAWASSSNTGFLMAYNRELKDTQRSLNRIKAVGNFITTGINGAIAI
ncbi:MAG: PQQ-binding-like beta-propeller repeat protein, partial [Phaeodactylibacter sp.]|nr:PQQ-binding-like beta-propeller repeat protein [Phaeodactylibacter sp.]